MLSELCPNFSLDDLGLEQNLRYFSARSKREPVAADPCHLFGSRTSGADLRTAADQLEGAMFWLLVLLFIVICSIALIAISDTSSRSFGRS